TLPNFENATAGYLTDNQLKTRKVKEILEGAGLDQAITYSLVSKDIATQFTINQHDVVELMMPMSEDQAVLRQSILPRLIDATRYNVESEEHTSELQSRFDIVCRLLLEKKKTQ